MQSERIHAETERIKIITIRTIEIILLAKLR